MAEGFKVLMSCSEYLLYSEVYVEDRICLRVCLFGNDKSRNLKEGKKGKKKEKKEKIGMKMIEI